MNRIKFESVGGQSVFLDPRAGFAEKAEEFPVRRDPLTGKTGHLSHFCAIKPQRLHLNDYAHPEVKGTLLDEAVSVVVPEKLCEDLSLQFSIL